MINAESYVSNDDLRGYVRLEWGKERGKFTPAEARMFAMTILACAEAAETDAFMISFLMDKVEVDFQKAILILRDFREYRLAQQEAEDPPPPGDEPGPAKPEQN